MCGVLKKLHICWQFIEVNVRVFVNVWLVCLPRLDEAGAITVLDSRVCLRGLLDVSVRSMHLRRLHWALCGVRMKTVAGAANRARTAEMRKWV